MSELPSLVVTTTHIFLRFGINNVIPLYKAEQSTIPKLMTGSLVANWFTPSTSVINFYTVNFTPCCRTSWHNIYLSSHKATPRRTSTLQQQQQEQSFQQLQLIAGLIPLSSIIDRKSRPLFTSPKLRLLPLSPLSSLYSWACHPKVSPRTDNTKWTSNLPKMFWTFQALVWTPFQLHHPLFPRER